MRCSFCTMGIVTLVISSSLGAQERIPISKDRPATATVVARPLTSNAVRYETRDLNLPRFDVSPYANMRDNDIVAHLATGDSIEIVMADLAVLKATDQRVRDYASMLSKDHNENLAKTLHVISDQHITPAPLPGDLEISRMRKMAILLENWPGGRDWDAAFLRFQIRHHQNEIDVLNKNIMFKHAEDLVDHMQRTRTTLGKHRDSARAVATTLGVSVP